LQAFVAAGWKNQNLSAAKRLDAQILAWLAVLHRQQPRRKPNLGREPVRRAWRAELKGAPHYIMEKQVMAVFKSPACVRMRGESSRPNRPR
jgi:hypothetical protein